MSLVDAVTSRRPWLVRHRMLLLGVLAAVLFPFVVSVVVDGAPLAAVWENADGNAKFLQGLAIEVFILALYAMSYDLVLGVAGLLSFGHAMFFAVGAYTLGIVLKGSDVGFVPALGIVLVVAVLQALLFAVVLPRVKGIGFALVTLGLASVTAIVITSTEFAGITGADVGLQGVPSPDWLDSTDHRFRFYLVALGVLVVTYLVYVRIVDSPTGKVLVAVRDNEDRALMLGYPTFWYKTLALVASSITAAFAGSLHTLHQPIVTPNVAGLGFTVAALLMILIGGVGTISGAVVGAAVYRLAEFYLDRWFEGLSNLLIGAGYILLVLFLPYGIVGTWRAKAARRADGRAMLARLVGGRKDPD
jgi:branched-chain amino acid transport system permease protein